MKVRLTTVTPLHIGGRESALNPLEFVVKDKRCYIVSEDKLAQALQEKDKLNDFSSWFAKTGSPVLHCFLRDQKLLNEEFLQWISNYSSASPDGIGRELRPCIRDAFQRPFLPGTSIKGAIRTAFLFALLGALEEPPNAHTLEELVTERLSVYRRGNWSQEDFKKNFATTLELEKDIFQRFVLRDDQQEFDPHTDLFRCLRVSDSTTLKANGAQIGTIKVFSDGRPKRFSLYAECLPPGSTCEFDISVDKWILEEFRKRNKQTQLYSGLKKFLENPLVPWKFMGGCLRQADCKFFSKHLPNVNVSRPPKDIPLVRLGWGSGLLGTTVDMLLPTKVQDIRNTLFVDKGNTPAPKTRRLVKQGNTYLPLGWAKVEVIQK